MVRPSLETRLRAVRMVLDEGQPVAAVAGELGVAASTLRRWVRRARQRRQEQWWAAQVSPVFRLLAEFGVALTEVRAANWWETCAVYRTERVAVLVVHSVEFRRVEVRLMRAALLDLPSLDHGRAFVTGVPGLNGHLADGLLAGVYPNRKQRNNLIDNYSGLEPDRVAAALAFWAEVLQERAPSLLRGYTSILDTWESDRPASDVTLHVPRTATASQEAAAVARHPRRAAARRSGRQAVSNASRGTRGDARNPQWTGLRRRARTTDQPDRDDLDIQ